MGTPIQKLFTDLKNANGATFVGQIGRLWYDPVTGLRVSDGVTPGGLPAVIAVTTASIGDLVIAGASISTINPNENLYLVSNGTGTVQVTGAFNVVTPSNTLIMQVPNNGFVNFYAAQQNVSDSAFEIIGSSNGASFAPINSGVMLQVTGNPGISSRIYNDSEGSYAVYTGRRYDGTISAPTAVQDGEDMVRYGGSAYNGTLIPTTGNARMAYTALGLQTVSNGGSKITFWTTPVNNATSAIAPVMTVTNSAITIAALLAPASNNQLDLGTTSTRWRNVYIGPSSIHLQDQSTLADVAISVNSGTIFLNGAQSIALGNLVINNTTLQTTTPDLNINVGNLPDTGSFNIYRQANFYNAANVLTMSIQRNGFLQMLAPLVPAGGTGALSIIGSTSGITVPVTNAGGMLHITGNDGYASRIVNDAFGNFSTLVLRSGLGTAASPSATSPGTVISRISSVGYNTSTAFGVAGQTAYSSLDVVGLDAWTTSTQGSQHQFYNSPQGQANRVISAYIDSTVGITIPTPGLGIKFSDNTLQTSAAIPLAQRGASSGVATLDSTGHLSASQIPSSLLGGVQYAGSWNASTNQPPLTNNTTTVSSGTEYSIGVSGTQNLGTQTGSVNYQAGGFVIYGNGSWQYVPPVSIFSSISATNHISVNTSSGIIIVTSDATSFNNSGTIVSRDSSGNFSANVITASLNGNAASASVAGTVNIGAQPYITSVGVLSSLTVSSTIIGTSQLANTATYAITAGYANSFNTATLMASAVTATNAGYAYSFNTATLVANAVSASTATNAGYAYSFNTATLVANAVTATKVANALTMGFGLALESGSTYDGSAAHTINNYNSVTGPITVVSNAYTLNLSTSSGLVILDNSQASFTITITNPVPGKIVRVMAVNMKTGPGATTVSITGLTAANSTNGSASFRGNSNGSVAIVEFICTTTATSGVYMNCSGAA